MQVDLSLATDQDMPASESDTCHLDRDRRWYIAECPEVCFDGQPCIHAETFIKSKLLDAAMRLN